MNHRRQILALLLDLLVDGTMQLSFASTISLQTFREVITSLSLYNVTGEEKKYKDAWILVDGGYPSWTSLICPFKDSTIIKGWIIMRRIIKLKKLNVCVLCLIISFQIF